MANVAKNKIDLIRAEYDKPGLGKHLAEMRADEQRRTVQESRPGAVVTVPDSLTTSEDNFLLKPIKGSVMLFWGRQNSPLIPKLERAYTTGDESALRQLSDEFAEQFERRPVVPIEEGFKHLFASPMYFDLLYGSKQLISRLALSDGIDYGAVGFAYNGGILRDASFRLLEYRSHSRGCATKR